MGSQGIFRAVFGRKGVGQTSSPQPSPAASFASAQGAPQHSDALALHPALLTELQRLEFYARGFGRRALRYVTTGEDAALLADMVPLARQNCIYNSAYQEAKPSLVEMSTATNTAVVKGEIAAGPQVQRLIAIRLAAGQISPPWGQKRDARELAVIGLSAMLNGGVYKLMTNYKIDWASAIPLETVFAHFRSVGGTMADLFAFILPRDDSMFVSTATGSWSASEACAQYLRAYPAAFAEAMGRVEPKNRANGIKLIHHHKVADVPEIEALLVAMLTKPFTKDDRAFAVSALAQLDPAQLLGVLQSRLPTGDIDTRHGLVEAAGRAVTPAILALLAERAKVEKAAKVQAAIAALVEVAAACETSATHGDAESGAAGYQAVTGEAIAFPARCDLGSEAIPAPSDEACVGFIALMDTIEAYRRQRNEDYNQRYASSNGRHSPPPPPFTRDEIEAAFATLTTAAPMPQNPPGSGTIHRAEMLVRDVRAHTDGQAWLRSVLDAMSVKAGLRILTETSRGDVRGLLGIGFAHYPHEMFGVDLLREWLAAGRIDLRDLAGADELRSILTASRSYGRDREMDALAALSGDAVWPWLAENMEIFDQALGLRPAQSPIPLARALTALAMFPAVPQRYLPRLTEIAVAEKRPLRLQAMALLRGAKDLAKRIEALLDDKRQPVRINAAGWLADIRSTSSEKALRARLKKEKSDPVRAALIIALERLGVDLTDVIGPASLIAEAEKANAKTPPKLPEWLVAHRLPTVRFKDGTSVPQAVVECWLALAIRLKDPGAHGQFGIYLDQLDPADARAFSNWVLESWIAYDTATATAEQAAAYAAANYHMSYRFIGSSRTPADKAAAIAEMTRDKLNELLNSGSDTKGMLALACRADPVWAAGRVRWFLKKHGRRSNQAMALLEAIAGTGAPAALQVVIAASTRLKQKSTQARAAEIAQRYAEDRGWSVDELADRTVPSAGFDDDGELELPCGEDAKPYVARLDAALAIHLFNPDGKPVKALPAGDDENSKDSKKAFTAAKKELGQIVTLQGERLFEAMCVERKWPVADWRLAFHQHPVMRRLIERLVWQGLDAEGQPLGLFRPTQEGDFTDAGDSDVAIDDFAAVRLAHGALVDAETCKAWIAHLKDYEIKPFIAQFDTLRSPLTAEQAEAEAITDRQGWAALSLTIRGAAEKRGYQRVMRDSGGCHEYVKTFPSHGITATIWHTGSAAEDQNQRLALKELKFTKQSHRGIYRLKDVPPVMLAECWADYHAVAAKAVFDPEWEKISPW
jgi:hypothetical protein